MATRRRVAAPGGRTRGERITIGAAHSIGIEGTGDVPHGADVLDPRRLVATATIGDLVAAIADVHDDFAVLDIDDTLWFRCPRCRERRSGNAGSAHVVDETQWRCHRCRCDGTRWTLERLVLDSSTAIAALESLIVEVAA